MSPEKKPPTPQKETGRCQEILFSDFITSVFPQLKKHPALIDHAVSLVAHLPDVCKSDEDGNFGVVRGGAMRAFLYDTQVIESFISRQSLLDNSHDLQPLTQRVLDHAFGLKDIDIQIVRQENIREDDKEMMKRLLKDHARLNDYRIKIKKKTDGNRSFFSVAYFLKKGSPKPILILSFNDSPVTEEERGQDIRDTEIASKVDQLARGQLRLKNVNQPIIAYNRDPLDIFFTNEFIDSGKKYISPPDKLTLSELVASIRTAGFAAFYSPMILARIDHQSLFSFFINHWQPHEAPPSEQIREWYIRNHSDIERIKDLIVSDCIYPLSLNPLTFLSWLYFTGSLDYLPLGQIINSQNNPLIFLVKLLFNIAEQNQSDLLTGSYAEVLLNQAGSLDGAHTLIKALIKLEILPEKTPINWDTAVSLFNPALTFSESAGE